MHHPPVYWSYSCCIVVLLAACQPTTNLIEFAGPTQGTSYSIRAYCAAPQPNLQNDVAAVLARIDREMSTYDPNSSLSLFNQSAPGAWQSVPAELATVVVAAQQLAEMSVGAFDITVGPLVNAWGFGPDGDIDVVPSADAVAAARARIGHGYLEVRTDPPALRKSRDLYVDVGAIAQGYTVDKVAQLLEARLCLSYMVEIGGEVRTGTAKPSGEKWQIGVEVPDRTVMGRIRSVLPLSSMAVSTSGDYRDFVEIEGRYYSHTMDPRSGAPVTHNLASVTVIHESAMWADGYATLLAVLGPTDGLAFAMAHHLAAQFVERTDAGYGEHMTPEFANQSAEAHGQS